MVIWKASISICLHLSDDAFAKPHKGWFTSILCFPFQATSPDDLSKQLKTLFVCYYSPKPSSEALRVGEYVRSWSAIMKCRNSQCCVFMYASFNCPSSKDNDLYDMANNNSLLYICIWGLGETKVLNIFFLLR